MWLRRLGVILCWCSLVFGITSTRADDTELFIYDFNKAVGGFVRTLEINSDDE